MTDWDELPLKAIYRRRDITGRSDLQLLSVYRDHGVVPREGREDNNNRPGEDLDAYRQVQVDDLVLNKMKTWQGSLGVSQYDGIVSPAYFVCEQIRDGIPRFLHHLLRSRPLIEEFAKRSKGIRPSQWDLPWDEFRNIRVLLPPLTDQRAIADFLDDETTRIDAIITRKQSMIELLSEQTRAWAIRLVLGDLDKEAGETSASWLYRVVPTGWHETALRHLGCDVQTGPFGSQLHAEEYVEDGWPVVNPMNIVEGEIVAVEGMTVSDEKRSELARHILQPFDIVFGRRGEMGRAGMVTEGQEGWLCGTGSLRLRLKVRSSCLLPSYLKLLLETPVAKSYFELSSVGSTMDNLNSEILLAFPTLVPPLTEQAQIVEAVRDRRRIADTAKNSLCTQIELLVERRQALITAAVTGALDVSGAVA